MVEQRVLIRSNTSLSEQRLWSAKKLVERKGSKMVDLSANWRDQWKVLGMDSNWVYTMVRHSVVRMVSSKVDKKEKWKVPR